MLHSIQGSWKKSFSAPLFSKQQQQVNHIALITFWSQFSVYVLNTVLILFLTRPVLTHGLGYSESRAYSFIGVTMAMGYLMPIIGGTMADTILGIRRSILLGSILLALAYLLVMVSGFSINSRGDVFFIGAFALVPVTNSLLMGTASAMVSKIYQHNEVKAKSGMLLYYMSINIGALLATILAPKLMESPYGPLTIFAVVFIGKAIAALNFLFKFKLYDDVASPLDKTKMSWYQLVVLITYLLSIYLFTLTAYLHPELSGKIIATGCCIGIGSFLFRTLKLQGLVKKSQLIAALLIIEAIVFFVLYNQMNTTLILFAKKHSDLLLLGIPVSSAHFQMINPLCIIAMSFLLPSIFKRYPAFTIPYQFAVGILLAGLALLFLWGACFFSSSDVISGNYIALTYLFLTIAELLVSAIGLSMIGLYCDQSMTAYAMGVWYLANSLSNIISSELAQKVAFTNVGLSAHTMFLKYQNYYFQMGAFSLLLGAAMLLGAFKMITTCRRINLRLA